ncbi:transketolase [soil metagenome]
MPIASKSTEGLQPNALRREIVEMAYAGSSVHIACAFSLVEVISTLLSSTMNLGAGQEDKLRDRIFLSKGHGVMALYAAYGALGWIDPSHLKNYFSDGSLLHGLSEARVPVLEVSSGSLGHGLPVAVGYALGKKRAGEAGHVYCIVGDGEMNEGSMWEALLFAGHHKLENLTVIVDANGHQAMGRIQDVINMEPFADKFRAFGFATSDCNGHSNDELSKAFTLKNDGKPRAVIARTIKGKGLSFMEDNNEWHYRRLTPELLESARAELAGAKNA